MTSRHRNLSHPPGPIVCIILENTLTELPYCDGDGRWPNSLRSPPVIPSGRTEDPETSQCVAIECAKCAAASTFATMSSMAASIALYLYRSLQYHDTKVSKSILYYTVSEYSSINE